MLRIENKLNGEIVETITSNWKNALNCIKYNANWDGIKINTKAVNVITNLKNGYEDKYIKAYLLNYNK